MNIPFQELKDTIDRMVIAKKGLLAADESLGTIGKRFAKINVESTYESRRQYRELLLTTPDIEKYISGVILFDETIHQSSSTGQPFTQLLEKKKILSGIKLDKGLTPFPLYPSESITEGSDGLHDRLQGYKKAGVSFAKWRTVIKIGKDTPSLYCIEANSQLLAHYASICQENGIVPIVEPEVLMDGNHTIEQCEIATMLSLSTLFRTLFDARVDINYIILKPNMVLPGKESSQNVTPQTIAQKTIDVLLKTVPCAVPMIAFLSGGQSSTEATVNLNTICASLPKNAPWYVTFSFSRALQELPLTNWAGKAENVTESQKLLQNRLLCNSTATQGLYNEKIEFK